MKTVSAFSFSFVGHQDRGACPPLPFVVTGTRESALRAATGARPGNTTVRVFRDRCQVGALGLSRMGSKGASKLYVSVSTVSCAAAIEVLSAGTAVLKKLVREAGGRAWLVTDAPDGYAPLMCAIGWIPVQGHKSGFKRFLIPINRKDQADDGQGEKTE